MFVLGLIILHYWDKKILYSLHYAPWILRLSIWLVWTSTVVRFCELGSVTSNPSMDFFLSLGNFLIHIHRSLEFFCCEAMCPQILCFMNSSCLGILEPQLCLLSFLGFFPLCLKTLSTVNWAVNHRAHLICFLSFRDHCPLLLVVQCLEKPLFSVFYMVFWLFKVRK